MQNRYLKMECTSVKKNKSVLSDLYSFGTDSHFIHEVLYSVQLNKGQKNSAVFYIEHIDGFSLLLGYFVLS
jgi:hypothetical protein